MQKIHLGKISIDENTPPIFFPDIGTFFNQDISLARDMIHRVKQAGAHFLKGEILHESICLDDPEPGFYHSQKGLLSEQYFRIIERKRLPLKTYEKLFQLSHDLNMHLVLSVYDKKGALFAKKMGACALKIASQNIVHQSLIENVASLNIPMIIDTGKANLEEIARAIQWAEDAGSRQIIVQHSPLAPPAPLEEHHLLMMKTLETAFDYPVGLSDHHATEEMLYASVALGAKVLEKGIVLDPKREDQDVFHALCIDKLEEVLKKCHNIFLAMGNTRRFLPRKRKKPVEWMGLVAKNTLQIGQRLSREHMGFAFPRKGIAVEEIELVEGSILKKEKKENEPICWQDIEF